MKTEVRLLLYRSFFQGFHILNMLCFMGIWSRFGKSAEIVKAKIGIDLGSNFAGAIPNEYLRKS